MDKKEILQYVKNHPSGKVKYAIADIDGILRGKYISAEKFLSVTEADTGFCDVIFGWDSADSAYDNGTYTGWHTICLFFWANWFKILKRCHPVRGCY